METRRGEWVDVRDIMDCEDGTVVCDVFGRGFIKRGDKWVAIRSNHFAGIGRHDRVMVVLT